ncbi:nectin-2-like isoform X2 [Trichosurus vulpecula]|uniref:nectin-2-like isoform X2 n=1 Tax=Trichosurus vulpecula TaxID=9337 RepID=UPI00186AFCD3|nr:nectin-2-like isoform X2 [Trichosurus vulpecula]
MAQASCLTLPRLLLLLLLPPHLGAAPQIVQVNVSSVVHGLLGAEVQLPCHLVPGEVKVQVSQVTWLRRDQTSGSRSIAVFHPTHGAGFPSTGPGEERLAFVSQSQGLGSEFQDATLVIRDLRAEDEANYTCEFATFPGGNSKGTMWLRVLAEPKNHAKAHEVTLGPTPMTMATCVSSGGRPPAQIYWSSPLAVQTNETRTAGPASNTFTVTSHLTLIPTAQMNKKKVICKVEHETLRMPAQLPVTLVVRYSPEVSVSSYDEDWYVGQKEASLNCDAQSYPKPTAYNWSVASGSLPPTAVSNGSKLIIRSVDWSVNTTFICEVTNAVGTGWANRTIHVKEAPAAKDSVGQVVGISVAVVVGVIVIMFLGYCLLTRRCPGQSHKNYSPNMEVSYATVPCTTSQPGLTKNSMADDINQNGR